LEADWRVLWIVVVRGDLFWDDIVFLSREFMDVVVNGFFFTLYYLADEVSDIGIRRGIYGFEFLAHVLVSVWDLV
jgi:hypothetical protein